MELRVVSDTINKLGESPIWDEKEGKLWWTDTLSKCLYNYDPHYNKIEKIDTDKPIGGFAFNKKGGLVCGGNEGIFLWNREEGSKLIAEEFRNEKLRINDTIADAKGRFLAGSNFFAGKDTEYSLGKLYIVDIDCSISVLDEGFQLSNGLGFSLDNSILYYTDTIERKIYAYDYDLEKGRVSNKRIFVKVSEQDGLPDGLTVDAEGFVWSAQWAGSKVVRYSPNGEVEREINLPVKQISSIIFGGNNLEDIFITTSNAFGLTGYEPDGYDATPNNAGGLIYNCNLGIMGKPENRAEITV